MGMTMAEKILAKAAGLAHVTPGQVVLPVPELVILHDGCVAGAHKQLREIGYRRITGADRVMIVTDHEVIHTSPEAIARAAANRRIAREWGIEHFYPAGRGGHGHLFPIEKGMVRPGMFLFAYDMHSTNFGAVGALSQRAGIDITAVLATGSLWTVVPKTLQIELTGRFTPSVQARDLGFWLSAALQSGRLGVEFDYRVVEFAGEALRSLTLSERVALCNTLTEIGVANILFPQADIGADGSFDSDPNASFEDHVVIDLADIEPHVALPGAPYNGVALTAVAGTHIDHAFIGACGSGMYEDFVTAARILEDARVADHVRFFIVPGTVETAERLAREDLLGLFMRAGAMVLPPGCGPCAGGVGAPLGPGEVSISTAATNGAGRMGSREAKCFLGSPATVACSAVAGCITDPRTVDIAYV